MKERELEELRRRIWLLVAGLELTEAEGNTLIREIKIRMRRPPEAKRNETFVNTPD